MSRPIWYFHYPMRNRLYEAVQDVNSSSEWVESAPKLKIENVGNTYQFAWGKITDKLPSNNPQPVGFEWIFTEQEFSWNERRDVPKLNYPVKLGKTSQISMYDPVIGGYRTRNPAIVVFPIWDMLNNSNPLSINTGELYTRFVGVHESKNKTQMPKSISGMTIPTLKSWLTKHNITFLPNQRKSYYIELVHQNEHHIYDFETISNPRFLLEQKSLRTETITAGKYILLHEREDFFPPGNAFPFFAYNWFAPEDQPGWDSGARYKYSIVFDIPNILISDKYQQLSKIFKEMYPKFTLVEPQNGLDYAIAAFAIQVLKYNGIIFYNQEYKMEFIILSPLMNKNLSLINLTANDNYGTPIKQHLGYSKLGIPEGQGAPPKDKFNEGKWFFTDTEVKKIRKELSL